MDFGVNQNSKRSRQRRFVRREAIVLINCPECKHKVSSSATTCTGCGYPIQRRATIASASTAEEIESWLNQQCGFPWRVIDRDDASGIVLAITEDLLEKRSYNQQYNEVSWENSTLRDYLNGDFYNRLPDEVKLHIVKTRNAIEDVSFLGERQSRFIVDKVFLLSKDEMSLYSNSELLQNQNEQSRSGIEENDPPLDEYAFMSPLEIWSHDSRQNVSSTYDEWEDDYDSALKAENEHRLSLEAQLENEYEVQLREWEKTSFWAAKHQGVTSSWWLRSTGFSFLEAEMQSHCNDVRSVPVIDILGIRPAICLQFKDGETYESACGALEKDVYDKPKCHHLPFLSIRPEPNVSCYDEDIPF